MQGLVDGPVSPEGPGKAHKPNKRRQVSKVSMTEATRVGTGVPNEDNRPEGHSKRMTHMGSKNTVLIGRASRMTHLGF